MLVVKVWLGGEGPCEIGDRAEGGGNCGAVEALLRGVQPDGWVLGGAQRWKHIRKYRAGAAIRGGPNHEDIHNVVGLVKAAKDAGCDAVAFTRDIDADDERASAISRGMSAAGVLFPGMLVIGGEARPALEGWILALLGVSKSDGMSRRRTLAELKDRKVPEKDPEAYVAIVDAADLNRLPNGCESLDRWLTLARHEFGRATHDDTGSS